MAIHAFPYQMETINELFSLLHAGRREKGTEQGWANLKQCRRLDACLGQTPINSFGLMGEARRVHRIEHWHGEESPPKLWGAPGSPALHFLGIIEEMLRGKAENRALAPCSLGKQRRGSYRPLSWQREGLRHQHVLPVPVPVPVSAKSRVSQPHPQAAGPVGERTSHLQQPREGWEYYTGERLLATLTH